jgi:Vps54-like protein
MQCLHIYYNKQVDVSPERQLIMDRLIGGRALVEVAHTDSITTTAAAAATGFASPNRHQLALTIGNSTDDNTTANTSESLASPTTAMNGSGTPISGAATTSNGRLRDRKREAVLDGNRYKAVWSALLLVDMASSLLKLSVYFPAAAQDILTRLAELLRLYNSRTSQLVLGAGAIHSASRLRSISAKHLALCSHGLGLIQALIPHIRAALAAQLPRKHHVLLVEMDRVAVDYSEHHEKVRIMLSHIIHFHIHCVSDTFKDVVYAI